ncbi:hypothetical protein [Nonomuraea sp. LPB2021202275-12-8]|uniref:hypothetical protein n=1 Tax=Nonomuraea sp. LPB2021202275-12-8 TaxID=3120159 RepID=UPI00300CA8C6
MVSARDLNTAIRRRDRLLLVLGLALMGRRSELVALTREDVREVADGLEVTIRTSKTVLSHYRQAKIEDPDGDLGDFPGLEQY